MSSNPPKHLPVFRRPKTRGECVNGPRPCPWASCQYSLLVDLHEYKKQVKVIDLAPGAPTCALDVADTGEARTQEEVGKLMGTTRQYVELIERNAVRKIRAVCEVLKEFL